MINVEYMRLAMSLALKAKGKTSPNPIVGAVIEKKGRIIAEGWHKKCGTPHAEIIALKKAGPKAKGANLWITLEPCCHHGRTPPCVDKVIQSGIKNVFIGMQDPNPLVSGRSIAKLKKAGVKVEVGILKSELERMNEAFIKYIRNKMPFVVAKCAQTLDGKIATFSGESKWITSAKTRDYARRIRSDFDAILVGINTILHDNPGLNPQDKSKEIKKIILDSSLKISPKAKVFKHTKPENCFIATTKMAGKTKVLSLQRRGINIIICPSQGQRVDLSWLLKKLTEYEITNVLIEGGAETVGGALKQKLVDKMHIYIAPKIMGDQNAVSSVKGLNITNVKDLLELKDIEITKLDGDVLIQGYVYRNR